MERSSENYSYHKRFRAQQCQRVSDISDVLSGVIVAASVTSCFDNFNFNLKFKTKWHQQCCYEIRFSLLFEVSESQYNHITLLN